MVALLRTTYSQDVNNRLEIHELKLARRGNLVKHLAVAHLAVAHLAVAHLAVAHLAVAVLNVAPVSAYQE